MARASLLFIEVSLPSPSRVDTSICNYLVTASRELLNLDEARPYPVKYLISLSKSFLSDQQLVPETDKNT